MHSTVGIILKKNDAGETDAVFVVYTKHFGKVRIFAQGVKKEAAKAKGHLEPLNLALIKFISGRTGERIVYAESIADFSGIRQNLDKLRLAWYLLELVLNACPYAERDEKMWEFLQNFLEGLEYEKTKAELRVERLDSLEQNFLRLLGFEGEKDIRSLNLSVVRPF